MPRPIKSNMPPKILAYRAWHNAETDMKKALEQNAPPDRIEKLQARIDRLLKRYKDALVAEGLTD